MNDLCSCLPLQADMRGRGGGVACWGGRACPSCRRCQTRQFDSSAVPALGDGRTTRLNQLRRLVRRDAEIFGLGTLESMDGRAGDNRNESDFVPTAAWACGFRLTSFNRAAHTSFPSANRGVGEKERHRR